MACDNKACHYCNRCLICGSDKELQQHVYAGINDNTFICSPCAQALGTWDRGEYQTKGREEFRAKVVAMLLSLDHPHMAERVKELDRGIRWAADLVPGRF
jgi:hypothetical protein